MKLISYPHTGTRFLREVLWRGWRMLDEAHPVADAESPVGTYTSHHTDELRKGLWPDDGELIVIPLRDPFLACITNLTQGWGMPISDWAYLIDIWFKHGHGELEDTIVFPVPYDAMGYDKLLDRLGPPDWGVVDWSKYPSPIPVNPVGVSPPNEYKTHYLRAGTCPPHPKLAADWSELQRSVQFHDFFRTYLGELPWMLP